MWEKWSQSLGFLEEILWIPREKGSAYEGVFDGKDKELWHIFPNNFKKNILRNMKKEPIELKYLKKYEKGTDWTIDKMIMHGIDKNYTFLQVRNSLLLYDFRISYNQS